MSCNKNTEQIELKLNNNIGDKQTIVSTTETSRGSLMSLKNVMETEFEVTSIKNEAINFKTNVARIMTEMKMSNEVEKYDSNKSVSSMNNDQREMHNDFKDILDAQFHLIIDTKGKVVKSFHFEDGRLYNEPVIDIKNYFLSFPNGKVGIGSTWTDEKDNAVTGQITKSTYTIDAITASEIIISIRSEIPGITGMLGANTATGNYTLDKATCKLIKGTLNMDLQTGGSVTNSYVTKN